MIGFIFMDMVFVLSRLSAGAFIKSITGYKQALIAEAKGIYIKAGKPAIGFQEPMRKIKAKPEASAAVTILQRISNKTCKVLWWNAVSMQEIKYFSFCNVGSFIHLCSPSFFFTEYSDGAILFSNRNCLIVAAAIHYYYLHCMLPFVCLYLVYPQDTFYCLTYLISLIVCGNNKA